MVAGTGRRVLLAVHVKRPLPPMRLVAGSLDILTFGGTLAGWARIVEPRSAVRRESIDVEGGWLQIAPFLPGRRLHARSEAVDLLVVPGGGPRAQLALRPGPLWNAHGQPMAARSLRVRLVPEIHMTRLHAVEATASFRFVVRHLSAAHERWRCTIATRFPLVDHEAARPDLWVLTYKPPRGAARAALALYSARTGAFEAVFLDPQTARAFAHWMGAVRARRAGAFRLGFIDGNGGGFAPLESQAFGHLHVAQWSGG
jgi:hypothetical protein